MIRPEHVSLQLDKMGSGEIVDVEYFGHDQLIELKLESGINIQSRIVGGNGEFKLGKRVNFKIHEPVITYPISGNLRQH